MVGCQFSVTPLPRGAHGQPHVLRLLHSEPEQHLAIDVVLA